MCGRFGFNANKKQLADYFGLEEARLPERAPRYNIAPTQHILCVLSEDGERKALEMHWGWHPNWTNSLMINVKSETAATKATFKKAIQEQRCLIPASGFYEWHKNGKRKCPYWIHGIDRQLLALAGLWRIECDKAGLNLPCCLILTTGSNQTMQPLHARMPAILEPQSFSSWLDPQTQMQEIESLMVPCSDEFLIAERVSEYVNSSSNEGPACLEPEPASTKGEQQLLF